MCVCVSVFSRHSVQCIGLPEEKQIVKEALRRNWAVIGITHAHACHTFMFTYACTHTHMHVYTHICMYTHTYMHVLTHMNSHTYFSLACSSRDVCWRAFDADVIAKALDVSLSLSLSLSFTLSLSLSLSFTYSHLLSLTYS